MNRPVITLLTDFGMSDHYVGAMKGVMLGICPEALLVDITHDIRPYGIGDAAFTLSQSWPYFPAGTVHLVVVDPGVGSSRRPILAEAGGHLFVAPDNGVLTLVRSAGQDFRAREISAARFYRRPLSRTFHGRDIFAPAAAHLAAGVPAGEFGGEIDYVVLLPDTRPVRKEPGVWTGAVLRIDRFGNIVTGFGQDGFPEIARTAFELRIGSAVVTRYRPDYASSDPAEIFLINGSSGYLEVSMNQRDAAGFLGIAPGARVELRLPTAQQSSGVPAQGPRTGTESES
jgi:hypothetical protein